jgi:hypothetical protein
VTFTLHTPTSTPGASQPVLEASAKAFTAETICEHPAKCQHAAA